MSNYQDEHPEMTRARERGIAEEKRQAVKRALERKQLGTIETNVITDRASPEYGRWYASIESLQGPIVVWESSEHEAFEALEQKTGFTLPKCGKSYEYLGVTLICQFYQGHKDCGGRCGAYV